MAIALVHCLGSIGLGYAAAPFAKVQNPGYFRMMLGDFEITALSDGTFDLDTRKMLIARKPDKVASLLQQSFQSDVIPISVNAYLVNTGERLILVDVGASRSFGPTLGQLLSNLKASGYQPDQIDAILLTHMHPDHIGGLILEGRRAFPNAIVYVERREANFWLNPAAVERAPAERKAFFVGAQSAIAPYARANRFEQFSAPVMLFPGISATPAPGHTTGHSNFTIRSRGQELVIWGDLMEVAAVQLIDPSVTIVFDTDPVTTVRQRPPAYLAAAKARYLVAAAHLPFPGIGHLRRVRMGYEWVPLVYDRMH